MLGLLTILFTVALIFTSILAAGKEFGLLFIIGIIAVIVLGLIILLYANDVTE